VQVVKQIEEKCAKEPAWGAAAFSSTGRKSSILEPGEIDIAALQSEEIANAGLQTSEAGQESDDPVMNAALNAHDFYSAAQEPGECLADYSRSLDEVVNLSVDFARIEERLR